MPCLKAHTGYKLLLEEDYILLPDALNMLIKLVTVKPDQVDIIQIGMKQFGVKY